MSFYVYVTGTGGSNSPIEVSQYVVNSLIINPYNNTTPVTVVNVDNIMDEMDGPIFMELISQRVNESIKEFKFVFAAVDVMSSLATNDAWAWLQPTYNGYAVAEPLQGSTNDNCVFAILSMRNNNMNPDPVVQVDANAITPNCTSSLLISPAMFLKKKVATGISSVFMGASIADFAVDEGNLTIANTSTVTWAMEKDCITMRFSKLSYPLTELDINVGHTTITFAGQFKLGLKTGSNGSKTLWFDPPEDHPNTTNVNSFMKTAYYEADNMMGYTKIGLSAIGIRGVQRDEITSRALSMTTKEAGAIEASAGTDEVQQAFKTILADPEIKQKFVDTASADGLEMLNETIVNVEKANIWGSVAKWNGTLAGLAGSASGEIQSLESILKEASQNRWEHTPVFSNLVDLAIASYSFAGLSNLNFETAGLAESLQVGFTTQS